MIQLVIADDESRICTAIEYVILNSFPQVKIAGIFNNGQDLFNYVSNHHVDILITDIEMPQKNGLDIIELIRAQEQLCYTIVITAYREFDYAVRALNSRVDAFITKPFSSEELENKVRVGLKTILSHRMSSLRQWDATSSLIKAAISSLQWETISNVLLCQGSTPLESLSCTEVQISSENINLMSSEQENMMIEDLKVVVEMDDPIQSVFILHKSKASILFLVFSKDKPCMSFLNNAVSIIERYTGSHARCIHKFYDSVAHYFSHLEFKREIDDFYKLLALTGYYQAECKLLDAVNGWNADKRNDFAAYLEENFEVKPENGSVHALIKSIETIANNTLAKGSSNYLVTATREFIQNNYANAALSLDLVADELGVSGGYLSRIFKSKTGQNFSEYLQKIRMDNAQRMLKLSNLSVNDIAIACGYNSATYFRMLFKTLFGITPRQYRQNQI